MRLCAACVQELPQESFSKKQWQMKQYQRRCKECIGGNRDVILSAPSPPEDSANRIARLGNEPAVTAKCVQHHKPSCAVVEEGSSCWICLEDGPDQWGLPLRRDCSCRGKSAGFGHLSCIVNFAQEKTERQWGEHIRKQQRGEWDKVDLNEFRRPWENCPNCMQSYQNDFAVDLATKFVTFVERTYPHDQTRLLEAFVLKLETLQNMIGHLKPEQKETAREVGNKALLLIGRMRHRHPLLSPRTLMAEAVTYSIIGRVILTERTKESAKIATEYFEKCKEANEKFGNTSGVQFADLYIDIAKSRSDPENNKFTSEDRVKRMEEVYTQRVEVLGPKAPYTLTVGVNLAFALQTDDKMIEAERLLSKLTPCCQLVHGPDHTLTKKAALALQAWKIRLVTVKFLDGWRIFQALGYTENGKAYGVQGPILTANPRAPRNVKDEHILSIDTIDVSPTLDTPVVCHGFKGSEKYLNDKVGQVRSHNDEITVYEIRFEDKELEPHMINHENILVLFDLPDV